MEAEDLYKQGFNSGYLIAKYDQNLLIQITRNIEPTTHFIDGFLSGKEQYREELTKEYTGDLKTLRDNLARGKDQERGE